MACSTSSHSSRPFRITVLISGSGSNLQALLDAANTPRLPNCEITYVLSSRSAAYGLTRARTHTSPIETSVCALKTFLNKYPGLGRVEYDQEVARRVVVEGRPDLVVLAGWMHILSQEFLSILDGSAELPTPRPTSSTTANGSADKEKEDLVVNGKVTQSIPIINLHPALPGAFDGANAIGRAHEAFQKGEIDRTGVMVHYVVKEVDRGQPIVVREVICKQGESLEDLEARMHEVEHEIIVEGARKVLEAVTEARSRHSS